MPAIKVENVSFAYGSSQALDGVSFSVEKGEIFGLLGPNGGGKTTLFRILCTLLAPQNGRVEVLGVDVEQEPLRVREEIGVVFQSSSLDKELTVRENLVHQGHLYGLRGKDLVKRIGGIMKEFGLESRSSDRVKILSGGFQRRVELAKGLLHSPGVLLLDEPTVGLDPGARYDFWSFLENLRDCHSMTILLTTHLMDEAERCDSLGILSSGKLVTLGEPQVLKEKIGGTVVTVRSDDPESLRDQIQKEFSCQALVVEDTVRIESARGTELSAELMVAFPEQILAVTVGKPTLEDVFVHETGHAMREEESLGVEKD